MAGESWRRFVALLVAAPWVAFAVVRGFGQDPAEAGGGRVLVLLAGVQRRVRAGAQPVARGPVARVMTANLRFGRADARAVVALARRERVDLLALVELSPSLRARLNAAGLDRLLPHGFDRSAPGASGAAVFSRDRSASCPRS